jgi:hypothetical protein
VSEINNQIRARPKQSHYTSGYDWWWDYDQLALLLSDPNNTETADEAGYVAIAPTEDRKGCKIVSKMDAIVR